jgi:hypothetical protein
MKHREEVAQFHGLMEEAKAIRDSEHKRTSDEMERLASDTIAAAAEEAGVAPEQVLAHAVDGALDELEGECPYCGAAVSMALKFCASCQRQLLGSESKGLGQSRTRPGAARPLHKTTEHSVGFSSRAKEQMGNNMDGLSTLQKALSMLLVLVVFYGCYAVFNSDDVLKSINRVMSSIQNKPESDNASGQPKPSTAPSKTSSANKSGSSSKK